MQRSLTMRVAAKVVLFLVAALAALSSVALSASLDAGYLDYRVSLLTESDRAELVRATSSAYGLSDECTSAVLSAMDGTTRIETILKDTSDSRMPVEDKRVTKALLEAVVRKTSPLHARQSPEGPTPWDLYRADKLYTALVSPLPILQLGEHHTAILCASYRGQLSDAETTSIQQSAREYLLELEKFDWLQAPSGSSGSIGLPLEYCFASFNSSVDVGIIKGLTDNPALAARGLELIYFSRMNTPSVTAKPLFEAAMSTMRTDERRAMYLPSVLPYVDAMQEETNMRELLRTIFLTDPPVYSSHVGEISLWIDDRTIRETSGLRAAMLDYADNQGAMVSRIRKKLATPAGPAD